MSETFWFRAFVVALVLAGAALLYATTHPRHAVRVDEQQDQLPNLDTPPVGR